MLLARNSDELAGWGELIPFGESKLNHNLFASTLSFTMGRANSLRGVETFLLARSRKEDLLMGRANSLRGVETRRLLAEIDLQYVDGAS